MLALIIFILAVLSVNLAINFTIGFFEKSIDPKAMNATNTEKNGLNYTDEKNGTGLEQSISETNAQDWINFWVTSKKVKNYVVGPKPYEYN